MQQLSKLVLLACFLLAASVTTSQAQFYVKEERKLLDKADAAFDDGDFENALRQYQSLLVSVPKHPYAVFKSGICYLNLSRPERGLASIKMARELDPDASAQFYYWLGRAFHLNQKVDSALYFYNRYKIMSGAQRNALTDQANVNIKQAEEFLKQRNSTDAQTFRLENMGGSINSAYTESNPLVSADGSFLVFTSRRPVAGEQPKYDGEYTSKVYYSNKLANGRWGQAQLLTTQDVGAADYTSLQFLDNDNFVLIFKHGAALDGKLLVSERFKGQLREPINYTLGVSNSYLEVDAYFNKDINRVFFTKFPKRAYLDIFTSTKGKDGSWSSPVALGNDINNSSEDDMAPFITNDQKEFFFCSRRSDGVGGSDIYRANYDATTGRFSNVRNAGLPYNSPGDEINYYEINNKGQRESYIAAERNSCFGKTDLFKLVKLEYVTITGRAVGAGGKPLANMTMAVTHWDFDDCDYLIKTDANGNYRLVNVIAGTDYKVAFIKSEADRDTLGIEEMPVQNLSGRTNMTHNFEVIQKKFVVPAHENQPIDKKK